MQLQEVIKLLQKRERKRKAQEVKKMETMELNLNEMEQVNGGTILGLLCVLGVVGGALGMAFGIGHALKDSDVKISNGML